MADTLARVVVDCSVVVKWKILTEDHTAAAETLLGDWEQQRVDVLVPNHLPSEVISAFLRAMRRGRLTTDEAREAIRDLLALPFVLCDVTALADLPTVRSPSHTSANNARMTACMWRWQNEKGASCGRGMRACTMP